MFSSEIEKKLNLIEPDAFFVFNNQPYILFFDLTGSFDSLRESRIHKQVWSFDHSPVIFIVKDDQIEIFNAFNYDKKTNRLQKIGISNEENDERFSFWNLQTGESWKWLQSNYYKDTIQKKRVNQRLFDNIKEVRERLRQDGLSEDVANILILRLIFIRYLIDRDVKIEEISGKTIPEKRQSFSQLIAFPQKLNAFFNFLNERLNGVLFQNVTTPLTKLQAQSLAYVFDERKHKNTPTLFDNDVDFYFEVFDFSIIPVEVISGIYESLINPETRNEQSAIYTPSFLVEYILNETIDKHLRKNGVSECTVLDPSCGSGIFLVQSYRRMIDKEKELFGEKIKKSRLRQIAQNNLFGIDLNEQALKVTCFSIYIALLDYQDPKSILGNFQFPKLIGENLFQANFFDTNHEFNEVVGGRQLDFVLGNPPWKSNKDDLHLDWLETSGHVTGRYEIAQSFLLRSKAFMTPATITSLVVTSTIFYNISKPTKEFKREFLTQFCLDRFFDLSPVRRLVFEEKSSPAAVVFYRLSEYKKHLTNVVHHLSIKSNIFLKHFKSLVIEKFDQKKIEQKHFIENDWMFKVALYGNTLDFSFLKRLQHIKTKISNLIDDEVVFAGAGIKSNKGDDFAEFLIGLPLIENKEIEDYYTPVTGHHKRLTADDVYYESGRKPALFWGNKILIKEQARNESDLVISYVSQNCVFKNGIWGISSKEDHILKTIFGYLISDFYTYYTYITACSWGVSTRPQIRFEDEFLSFPYKEMNSAKKEKFIDLVEKFLLPLEEYYKEDIRSSSLPTNFKALNKINKIIRSLYEIKPHEMDLIDYVLNVSRYQFQESKQKKFNKQIEQDQLNKYIEVFLSEFESVYDNEYFHVEVYSLEQFVAINFILSKEKPQFNIKFMTESSSVKDILKKLSENLTIHKITDCGDPQKNLYIQKDIKGFESNSFYIIKPNEYKCWHPAMAWYDVAEIKDAIGLAESELLNENS